MAYRSQDARVEMLDEIGASIEQISLAIAALGEVYEELDVHAADQMEEQIFRPLQQAYSVLRRTHSEFAGRFGLSLRAPAPGRAGMHASDPRVYLERATTAAEEAEQSIADLQDSLKPVDVGDPQLRAGLAQTRTLLAPLPERGRRLVATLGR